MNARAEALQDAKNAEDAATLLRHARNDLWWDLVGKHRPRECDVVLLEKEMLFAGPGLEGKGSEDFDSFRAEVRQMLEAEVLSILAAGMAGSPDAPKRWRRYEDAFRRIAQGVPPPEAGEPPNLETRALYAFAWASNEFRELPAQTRVLARIEEEIGKKLPPGSKKKVLATIAPLYKSL